MSNFKDLDALLQELVDRGPVPGMGMAVAKDGEILYEGYYGLADVKSGTPVTEKTVYRQFSNTKVALYTAAMMLFEKGKFLLNDPLYEYFPEWRHVNKFVYRPNGQADVVPTEGPVEIRHILSMTCGLSYGRANAPRTDNPMQNAMNDMETRLAAKGPYTLREEIRQAATVPQAFEPGTHWQYGFCSELTAGLIEVITGKRIWDAMKDLITEPLDMKDTAMHYFGDIKSRMATLYSLTPDGKIEDRGSEIYDRKNTGDPQYEGGCPRFFSTVRDYVNLTQMLANGGVFRGERIMGRKTIDMMRQNQLCPAALSEFRDKYLAGYGYGCGVRTMMDLSGGANTSIGEFGWTGASGTYVSIDPAEHVSVVYMHQMQPNMELYYHHRIRNVAYGCIE